MAFIKHRPCAGVVISAQLTACRGGVAPVHPKFKVSECISIRASEPERRVAYRQYADEEAAAEVALIRRGTREERPTGSDTFCAELLRALLDREVASKPRRRPQKCSLTPYSMKILTLGWQERRWELWWAMELVRRWKGDSMG